ncbi:LacI family DNA-binding transcriptional regulator [Cellulomonas sp. P22]|uniref:LacI family DNA-binding transcriptional regulator n=1 Tax=Cellulomonas sp. P22 TaxID=3373189 RepID=UPI00379B8147
MSPARPTLIQVAELAGVSVASASRALNGMVASAETVAKVRAAALSLGYVPDATARSLKLGHSLQLAFAVDDVGNPVYVEMMRAIESVVSGSGYRLLVSSTGAAPAETVDLVRSLARGYADGLIISPLRVTDELVAELQRVAVPVVVVGSLPQSVQLDTVQTDSARGVALAVDHLVDSGRRQIGFLNGPLDTTPGTSRQRGFVEAYAAHRLTPTVSSVQEVAADFTVAAGRRAALDLLSRHRGANGVRTLDALVAANDLLAVGAVHAALELGLRVPEDLAVVGMDDTELAGFFNPGLTSVSLGSAERGRHAAELLLDRLAEPTRVARRLVVQPTLVVRGSTVVEPKTAGDVR